VGCQVAKNMLSVKNPEEQRPLLRGERLKPRQEPRLYATLCVRFNFVSEKKREAVCVQRNIEARSRNHCCRGKAVSITYSAFVSIAIFIQCAKHILWSVRVYHVFFSHCLINGTILGKSV
jgi:hypothetical protein